MSVFGNYSNYYDLLYKDKDYEGEAKYISKIIKKYNPSTIDILDLGCGTGRHDCIFADIGYKVTGVDLSSSMIDIAKKRGQNNVDFYCKNICDVKLNKTFDAVISLFHVMSYQIDNENLLKVLKNAHEHLNQDGIFIFDCWYGPAVLTDRPEVRIKRLEDKNIKVYRIAEPVMHPNENIVDVNYDVLIENKSTGKIEEIKETHRMRYLFKPEILYLLDKVGFKLIDSFEFMTDKNPGFDTWGVCFVIKKI